MKGVLSECVICKKLKGKLYSFLLIVVLLEFRVREVLLFFRVGVDFVGFLYVKSKKGEMEKVYIVLFLCCVIRVVYLELVEDLFVVVFRCCL